MSSPQAGRDRNSKTKTKQYSRLKGYLPSVLQEINPFIQAASYLRRAQRRNWRAGLEEAEGSWNWLEEAFEIFCAAVSWSSRKSRSAPLLVIPKPAAWANDMWVIGMAVRQSGPLPGDSIGSGGATRKAAAGRTRAYRPMAHCNVL